MLRDGTSRPTNPEYEPDGIHQEGGAASPGCDEPDPVTSRLAYSFLVKQPGARGTRLQTALQVLQVLQVPRLAPQANKVAKAWAKAHTVHTVARVIKTLDVPP